MKRSNNLLNQNKVSQCVEDDNLISEITGNYAHTKSSRVVAGPNIK